MVVVTVLELLVGTDDVVPRAVPAKLSDRVTGDRGGDIFTGSF